MAEPTPSDDDPVLIGRIGPVGVITLNRPSSLNAMNGPLMDGLRAALLDFAADHDVRCVVLRGKGRSFSAGGDVALIARKRAERDAEESVAVRIRREQADLLRRSEASLLLRSMGKPTVAVLHGHVIGGGLALALAADLRVARSDTKLRVGFGTRALSGDFGITYLLAQVLGDAKARELLLLDPVVDAATALSLGLLTSVHEPEEFEAAADELIDRLAHGPTLALGRMKNNLEAVTAGASFEQAMLVEAMNQRVCALSADSAESGRAFLERRDPKFVGG